MSDNNVTATRRAHPAGLDGGQPGPPTHQPGSTNALTSMISICRDHARNVKRCRDGQMVLRWCAAGMVEAGKSFRRVNGHLHLCSLSDKLQQVTQPIGSTHHDEQAQAA